MLRAAALLITLGDACESLRRPRPRQGRGRKCLLFYCFIGTYVGLYTTGNGRPASAPAAFDWFDYEPRPDR